MRIEVLVHAILLGTDPTVRKRGFVGEVNEDEAKALIQIGSAKATKKELSPLSLVSPTPDNKWAKAALVTAATDKVNDAAKLADAAKDQLNVAELLLKETDNNANKKACVLAKEKSDEAIAAHKAAVAELAALEGK